MKAGLFHEHGDIDVLKYEDTDTPKPGTGEVLVEVKACSVNHLDIWVRKGLPGLKLPMPHIGGSDIVGLVAEVGAGVEGVEVGARVVVDPNLYLGQRPWSEGDEGEMHAIIGEHTRGGFAEYALVPAQNLLPLPDHVEFEQAAAVPLVFLTAWRMVMGNAKVSAEDTVLVLGAGGGVASAAIQIAKLAGASVYATAGSPDKLDKAKQFEVDELINHREQDFSKAVWKLTEKRGVDVIIDPVGGSDTLPKSVKALAKYGRYVTCGATTGPTAELNVPLMFWKQINLYGSTMGSRKELADVLKLVWQGKLHPMVDQTLPLSDIKKAHELIESRNVFGKLVMVP